MPGEHHERLRAALKAKLTPDQLEELEDLNSPKEQENLKIETDYLDAKQRLKDLEERGRLTSGQYRERLADLDKRYRKLRFGKSGESKP